MSEFNVGDKVKCIGTDRCAEDAEIGDVGEIIFIDGAKNLRYLVEFAIKRSCYHDGGGRGKNDHCYFCSEKMLELVDEKSEFKFKVGDKVVGNKKAGKRYRITRQGWTGVVTKVYEDDFNAKNAESGEFYHLDYDCFDLFENNSGKKIVIHTDGKKTIAELYEGDKVIKTKIAKCNDDDEFDFETGAKIAFDRLLERVTGDTPYLTCNEIHNSPSYGVIGTPTNYKDVLGRSLFVGDTVDIFTLNGDCVDETCVVETKADGQFIMGIACDCNPKKGTTGNWKILKKRSYKDVEDGESVGMIDYKK